MRHKGGVLNNKDLSYSCVQWGYGNITHFVMASSSTREILDIRKNFFTKGQPGIETAREVLESPFLEGFNQYVDVALGGIGSVVASAVLVGLSDLRGLFQL